MTKVQSSNPSNFQTTHANLINCCITLLFDVQVVEYLVGDGPSNRYALICKQCYSHNGMALKEEFEYVGKSSSSS
jgi:hypothetical protein